MIMCSCCEMVTLVYNYAPKKLCLNFRYEDMSLKTDLSLDSVVFKNMTTTIYRPFEMRAAVPGCRYSKVSVQILELNQFPQSLTICPRLDITGKKSRWQITYTCISIATMAQQQNGSGMIPDDASEEEEDDETAEGEADIPVVMMVVPMPIRQPPSQQNSSALSALPAQNSNSQKRPNSALTIKLPPGRKPSSSNTPLHQVLSLPMLTPDQIAQIPKGNLSEVIKILLQRSMMPIVSSEQSSQHTIKITTSRENSPDQSSSPENIDLDGQASQLFELLADKLYQQRDQLDNSRMSGKVKIVSEQSKESIISVDQEQGMASSPIYKCSQVQTQIEKLMSPELVNHYDQTMGHIIPSVPIGPQHVPVPVNITDGLYGTMQSSPLTKLHPLQPGSIQDYLSFFGQEHFTPPNSTKQVLPIPSFQSMTTSSPQPSLEQRPVTGHHLLLTDRTKIKPPSHLPQIEELLPSDDDSEEITLSVQVKVPSKNPPTSEDAGRNLRLINLTVSTTIRETSEKVGNKTTEINKTHNKDFSVLLRERNNNSDVIIPRCGDFAALRSENSRKTDSLKPSNVRRNPRTFRRRKLDLLKRSSRIVNNDGLLNPVVTIKPTTSTPWPVFIELPHSILRPTASQLSNSEVEDLLTGSAHVIKDYESVEGLDTQIAHTPVYNRADNFPQRTPPLIGTQTEANVGTLDIYKFIEPKIKLPSPKQSRVPDNTNVIFPDN